MPISLLTTKGLIARKCLMSNSVVIYVIVVLEDPGLAVVYVDNRRSQMRKQTGNRN